MKKFDVKSMLAGFFVGIAVIGTTFAAGSGIQSAVFNTTKVTLDGNVIPLQSSLISITLDGQKNASNYMPLRELLESLGYAVEWDGTTDTVKLSSPKEIPTVAGGDRIIDINTTYTGNKNIAKSGSFEAKDGQSLSFKISSDIKDGSVDIFLFSPSGEEQRITLDPTTGSMLKDIPLSAGTWAYNCTGFFERGSVYILGTIKE